jgi:hypothetical protein
MDYFGIDISQYQGNRTDWDLLASKVSFMYIRAGTSCRQDLHAEYNAANAQAKGIPFGLYWYVRLGDTYCKPHIVAEKLCNACKAYGGALWPAIDLEGFVTIDKNTALSWVRTMIDTVYKLSGRQLAIYTGPYWYNSNVALSNSVYKQPLWIAHWEEKSPMLPYEWSRKGQKARFWQYSADGNGQAVNYGFPPPPYADPDLDLDRWMGSAEEFYESFGVYPKDALPPEPPKPPKKVATTTSANLRSAPNLDASSVVTLLRAGIVLNVEEWDEESDFVKVGPAYLHKSVVRKAE